MTTEKVINLRIDGRFFHEAAASVVDFSHIVGRAFQCQVVVSVLNSSIRPLSRSLTRG